MVGVCSQQKGEGIPQAESLRELCITCNQSRNKGHIPKGLSMFVAKILIWRGISPENYVCNLCV